MRGRPVSRVSRRRLAELAAAGILCAAAVTAPGARAGGSGHATHAASDPSPGFVLPVGERDALRVPAAPTTTRSWLARVILKTPAYAHPSHDSKSLGNVPSRSPWGGVSRLLVLNVVQAGDTRWLQVRLPGRPNARSGWITDRRVELIPTKWRIDVSTAEHRLTVYRAGQVARSVRVVVGKRSTPTPKGLFAILDKLEQPNGRSFDGAWILPLTAHSNVLRTYDGGDGQVALHGRGGASLRDPLGTSRSHGCVRMTNRTVEWIGHRVPVGTPVLVH